MTIETMNSKKMWIAAGLVIAGAATRMLPLLFSGFWNFTAVGALAIFAGAKFENKYLAFSLPVGAMLVSDLFIPEGGNIAVYAALLLSVFCGILINKKESITSILGASFGSSLVFFLITNFALLYPTTMYTHNLNGVIMSYIAGLSFALNTLLSTVVYSAILFGAYAVSERRILSVTK